MNISKDKHQDCTTPSLSHINVGTGLDCTIRELVVTVAKVVGYQGEVVWDTSKPDGPPRKLLDIGKIKSLGWNYQYSLEDGLLDAYRWFLDNQEKCRK